MEIVTKEVWKDIPGYEGRYQVSNLGRIKSLKFGKERLMKLTKDKGNYLRVNLYKDEKQKNCKVHRLVAEAFIDKIEGKEFVDHINSDRQNNKVENLRWCTHKENDNFELARKHRAESKGKKVLCIELDKIFRSTREAERELGIDHSSISACCLGKTQSSGKHPVTGEKLHWEYID